VFSGDHSELRPAYEAVPYTPGAVSDAVAAASGRPLIMVVRDLHRHPWMASAAEAVAAARPDVTVVEMGVPYGVGEKSVGATLIATHGAARVSGLAAAEALTGRPLRAAAAG
jgi:beta-N-acetylhexosaminidase